MLEFWYIPLIIMVPLFFFWTLVHESAHAIVAKRLGGTITQFKPYPCKVNGKWYFGYFQYYMPNLTQEKRDKISIAPYIADMFLGFSASLVVLAAGVWLPPWLAITLLTLVAAPILNTGNQARLILQKKECDLSSLHNTKLDPFPLTLLYIALLVGGILCMVVAPLVI